MNLMISMQQGAPLAGWSDQYTVDDLNPAHARSYEPRGVNSGTTARMIRAMINYYQLTGETKFLARIPEAIAFLESQALPESEIKRFGRPFNENSGNILVPRFICPDTGKPQYVHRSGSNYFNGKYFYDQDISGTIGHYASAIQVNISGLKRAYEQALTLSPETLKAESPLYSTERIPLPKYYTTLRSVRNLQDDVAALIQNIHKDGYWLSPIPFSNPYKVYPKEGVVHTGNEYLSTNVGDEYDTSPFNREGIMGISTEVYINNMMKCIIYLDGLKK